MSELTENLNDTYSVCPICLKRIPAERRWKEDGIYLHKSCPEHGAFASVIWRNRIDFAGWRGERASVGAHENLNCHACAGLCAEHLRDTCCTLLEITERCNMNCTFCFAELDGSSDPKLEQVKQWIDDLTVPGKTLLQLSGGEPTVREDLPEIVAYAKKAGCKYVQLNSNGLRLSEDEDFVRKLSEAGLSFVFMQFDGVTDAVYERLRRRPMLDVKKKAIENCGKYGIGVTLVPVIVPGVNEDQIGEIIRFAVSKSPQVRGVHFQPVSYFGRIPEIPKDEDRFTLDELIAAVVEQTDGLVQLEHIAPSCCDHPMCGFHSDFVVLPGERLYPLTHYKGMELFAQKSGCCSGKAECKERTEPVLDKVTPAEKNREFVGKRWERKAGDAGVLGEQNTGSGQAAEELDMTDMETFLRRARSHGFTLTSMAFQDAGTLDIERLRQCSLHVYRDGKKRPFCVHYLSGFPMKTEEKRDISGRECELCRPGGFHMTETLFSFIEEKTRKLPLALLDVGCGSGAAMQYLKEQYPNWQICGIDPKAEKRLQDAKQEWEDSGKSTSMPIFCGEAESLPFSDHSMDVILMECSFSKTWDPVRALREMFRVLKTDGWLLLSDMYAQKEEIRAEGDGILGRLETHQTIFSRLRSAGFSVLEMQDYSRELTQWIGQKIMDGEACGLYESLGVRREDLKRAGCGYFICAAKPSGLWETLNYTVENSPFYRKKWGQRGKKENGKGKFFDAGDWETFLALPYSGADEIRENPDRFVCVNPKEIARVITLRTSGSQGNPKRLFFTEEDLLRTADFFEKGMQYLIHPGERVTVYMEGPGRFSIGGLMKEGLSRIGSEVTVHGLIRDLEAAAEDGKGADCFVGVPLQMYRLAVYAPQLRPKTVLLSADYVPDSVQRFLEQTWSCTVFTHWGMTETGYGGGVQCKAREGYHLRDEDLFLEVIHPETGEAVPDGEVGELVLTTLKRRGMPLIRYRTGDLGRMITTRCGCGCLKPRLDKVEGRLEDTFFLFDRKLRPIEQKSSARIALRRRGIMSLKRPAAGGESRERDSFLPGGRVLSIHILDELLFSVEGIQDFRAVLNRKENLLSVAVQEKEGTGETESMGAVRDVLEAVREVLEEQYGEVLRIQVQKKELSLYIGSGKRRLEIEEEREE